MTQAEIEAKFRSQGLDTMFVTDRPGEVYRPHRHAGVSIFSLRGSVKIKLDGLDWVEVVPGQVVVIGPDQLHEAVVGADGWEYIFAWDPEDGSFEEFTGN